MHVRLGPLASCILPLTSDFVVHRGMDLKYSPALYLLLLAMCHYYHYLSTWLLAESCILALHVHIWSAIGPHLGIR